MLKGFSDFSLYLTDKLFIFMDSHWSPSVFPSQTNMLHPFTLAVALAKCKSLCGVWVCLPAVSAGPQLRRQMWTCGDFGLLVSQLLVSPDSVSCLFQLDPVAVESWAWRNPQTLRNCIPTVLCVSYYRKGSSGFNITLDYHVKFLKHSF